MADSVAIAPGEEVDISAGPLSGSNTARRVLEGRLDLSDSTKMNSARRTRDEEELVAGGDNVAIEFSLPDGEILRESVSCCANSVVDRRSAPMHVAGPHGHSDFISITIYFYLIMQFPLGQDVAFLKGYILRQKNVPIPAQAFSVVDDDGSSKVLIDPLSLADYKQIKDAAAAKRPVKINVTFPSG